MINWNGFRVPALAKYFLRHTLSRVHPHPWSLLITRRRTLDDTRARDTICLIPSRAPERDRENDGNQKSPGVTPRTSDCQRQVLIWNNNLP